MSAISSALTGGVQSLGSWAFEQMTSALVATTQVNLGGWFDGPWRAMLAVAGLLALPILLAGAPTRCSPVARQRVSACSAVPLAVGPMLLVARAALGLVLALVDAACALVVQVGIGGPGGFARSARSDASDVGDCTEPAGASCGVARSAHWWSCSSPRSWRS